MKMERKNTWILYVSNLFRSYCNAVLYLLVWSVSTETCPDPCTYFEDSANVTCLDSQEIDLPLVVPQWTNTLILRGTNISALPESAFLLNGTDLEFKTLQLSWNNIQVIEAHAFRGLSRLQRLDLSHNTLTTVSARAFCGLQDLRVLYLNNTLMSSGAWELRVALSTGCLRNLQRLDLSGNRLKAIPIARFDNLNLNTLVLTNNSIETIGINNISSFKEYKKIRIYLSLNPFKCNCDLQAFYYWLKNDSQCADSSRLLCALPETKRGLPVEKLLKEDIDCINAELETVSYVFLGIVLALIGVVFLMVLYLNRGGIKRWLNNIRDACRDQMEVYHYRYEQDSDPRLENVAV